MEPYARVNVKRWRRDDCSGADGSTMRCAGVLARSWTVVCSEECALASESSRPTTYSAAAAV